MGGGNYDSLYDAKYGSQYENESLKNYTDHLAYVKKMMETKIGIPKEMYQKAEADSYREMQAIRMQMLEYESMLKKPAKPKFTREQKMNRTQFSLSDIERLCDAFSLSINDPKDRENFDIMFRNWREDRLDEIS